MLVDCPSPVGVMTKGSGLLLGAIFARYQYQREQQGVYVYMQSLKLQLSIEHSNLCQTRVSKIVQSQISTPCHASKSCIKQN